MDVAAGARTIDRLPLALGFRAHLDGHAFVENGKRLGPPLRGSETWGTIATRVRNVGRGDRLAPGFGPTRAERARWRRCGRRRWRDRGRINRSGLRLHQLTDRPTPRWRDRPQRRKKQVPQVAGARPFILRWIDRAGGIGESLFARRIRRGIGGSRLDRILGGASASPVRSRGSAPRHPRSPAPPIHPVAASCTASWDNVMTPLSEATLETASAGTKPPSTGYHKLPSGATCSLSQTVT